MLEVNKLHMVTMMMGTIDVSRDENQEMTRFRQDTLASCLFLPVVFFCSKIANLASLASLANLGHILPVVFFCSKIASLANLGQSACDTFCAFTRKLRYNPF